MQYRSPKLLKSAQGQRCQYCDSLGTTVSCHANRVALGKGTGIKAPDFYVAWLCQECHSLYDGRTGRLTKDECDELWTRAYLRTVREWFLQGIVGVQ
jgi:hypothetical protein